MQAFALFAALYVHPVQTQLSVCLKVA